MDANEWSSSETLAFLMNALGHSVAAVPFASRAGGRTNSSTKREAQEPHGEGSTLSRKARDRPARVSRTDPAGNRKHQS